MIKDMTKFHKRHLGGCVCRVSYRILSFWRGGENAKVWCVEGVFNT